MTTTQNTRHPRTFTLPSMASLSLRRDDYHGGKFIAVILLALVSAYAGYMGWVTLPSISEAGSLFTLIGVLAVVAVLVWAVNTDRPVLRTVALISALVGGIIIGARWQDIRYSFAGFTVSDWVGFAIGLVILLATATWVSRKDVRVRNISSI